MALKGDVRKIQDLKAKLRALPKTLAADVAREAAPAMTGLTQTAFTSGQSVYGDARPPGVDGQPLDLHVTGTVQGQLRFVAVGTIVRCVLGPKYSKYLIGKYGILPNGAMPAAWRAKLDGILAAQKVAP